MARSLQKPSAGIQVARSFPKVQQNAQAANSFVDQATEQPDSKWPLPFGIFGVGVKTNNMSIVVKDAKTGVTRKHTRPKGEFGGNLGCFIWTVFLPMYIYYFYGVAILHQGALVNPLDKDFWNALVHELPEGLNIWPTWKGFGGYALWIFCQMLMEVILPVSKIDEGVTLKNGRRLKYPMNGTMAFCLSHAVCYGLCYAGLLEPQFVWRNMGSLISSSLIMTFSISTWMYVDYGLLWRRHVAEPEFEEDWGAFYLKDAMNDWWLGVARNPRFFHKWLTVPFDLKRFSNARPSLTVWVICNQSYIAAIYYGCRLVDGQSVCNATGDWANVGLPALLITAAHCYYVFDYNWNEPAYLTTTDIRHDLYGWMLAFGCLSWVAFFYPVTFLHHIAWQTEPLNNNPVHFYIGFALHLIGMFLFRVTNIQKHRFRSFIANGGDLSTYKIWGKPVEYIKTEEGSYLLTSGYWGLARHFNYIGDLVMCIGWAIACAGPFHGFPWAPVSYVVYFWMMDIHRLHRDEQRCERKYKQDWIRYKEKVPNFLIPVIW